MAAVSGVPPEEQNPFERSGLAKGLVDELVAEAGSEGLRVVLQSVYRGVIKAVHPDIPGRVPSDLLKTTAEAYGRLSEYSDDELTILARAYARGGKRRRSPSVSGERETVNKEYVRDGSIITGLIDMVATAQEGIPSAKGWNILVRPAGYDYAAEKKPAGGASPNLASVGLKKRVFELTVQDDGLLAQRAMTDDAVSEAYLEGVKYHARPEARHEIIETLSKNVSGLLRDLAGRNAELGWLLAKFEETQSIKTAKIGETELGVSVSTNRELVFYEPPGDKILARIPAAHTIYDLLGEGYFDLLSGNTVYDRRRPDEPRFIMGDHTLRPTLSQPEDRQLPLFIIGSAAKSIVSKMTERYKNTSGPVQPWRVALPSASRAEPDNLPLLEIPEDIFPLVETTYSPLLERKSQLLLAGTHGNLYVAGSIDEKYIIK